MQQGLLWELYDLDIPLELATHDRGSKFVSDFDSVLRAEGATVALTRYRRSRASAHCEGVIKTIRRERLDWLIILSERYLALVLRQYLDHYNRVRPHLALALQPPSSEQAHGTGAIVRRRHLYGLINESRHA